MGNAIRSTGASVQFSVGSFQLAVFSESHIDATDRRDFALSLAERRNEAAKLSSIFGQMVALFMLRAHRDATRLDACLETGRRCEVSTEG